MMPDPDAPPRFSLIWRGSAVFARPRDEAEFNEQITNLQTALTRAFGNANCLSSIFRSRIHGRPSEIADNLGEADAIRRAGILRDAGFVVDVVATEQVAILVPEIGWRAEQCWPTHATADGHFLLSRVDGLVISGPVGNSRDFIRQARVENPNVSDAAIELFRNHEHPTHDFDRNALRESYRAGSELASALRECFPNDEFLVVHRDTDVSFCRAAPELRVGINEVTPFFDLRVSEGDGENGRRYCESCGEARPVTPRAEPDSEFPRAIFGDCDVCGGEVLMDCAEEVVRVGP